MNAEKSLVGVALVLCAAALWGTTGTAQSFAPSTLSSLWVGALRLMVASIFFLICVIILNPKNLTLTALRSLPFNLLFIAAVGMAAYNLTFFAGVRTTSVAGGTALALGSGPIWAGLIEILFLRYIPAKSWWLGVAIAIVGLCLVTGGLNNAVSWPLHGIGLCLLSGLSYAVYGLSTKSVLRTTSPLVSVFVVFTLAALMALVGAAILTGTPQLKAADTTVLLWLGVVATGFAYLLFSFGLRYLNSSTGIALALAEPIAALMFAVAIIGERPAIEVYAGIGIMLLGLLILILSELSSNTNHSVVQ